MKPMVIKLPREEAIMSSNSRYVCMEESNLSCNFRSKQKKKNSVNAIVGFFYENFCIVFSIKS